MVDESSDIVDMRADADIAKFAEPVIEADECEAGEDFSVADIVPIAGLCRRKAFEQPCTFAGQRDLVI